MSDPIKNEDLCDRCRFGEYSEVCRSGTGCAECPQAVLNGLDLCRCNSIEANTPCPYFEEDEDYGANW